MGLLEDAVDALEMDEERLSSRSWYAKTPEDREPVEEIESERSMARIVGSHYRSSVSCCLGCHRDRLEHERRERENPS